MDVAIMIGAVVFGAILVGVIVLLILRLTTSKGAAERESYLNEVAEALGGELGRSGLMGAETLTVRTEDIVTRIILVQNACIHQTRYTTHFISRAPARAPFVELCVQTTGNSPQRAFSGRLPPKIETLPMNMPHGLEFYSPTPEPAQQTLGNRRFQEFISRLLGMIGLAKFELLQSKDEFKFSIEGFIFEKEPLVSLYELLSGYVKD